MYTLGLFTNNYPSDRDDWRGVFTRRMVEDLESFGVIVKKAVKTSPRISGYARFYTDSLRLVFDPAVDIMQAEYIPHSSLVPAVFRGKCPLVLKFHGDDARIFPHKNRINLAITRWMMGRSSYIITASEEIRRSLIGIGAGEDRISAIHSGVDTEYFKPFSRDECRSRLNIASGSLVFLFVGRLHPWKGIYEIIGAARALPEYTFIFVGPGTPPEHPSNCLFVGPVPSPDVRVWMNAADCMLLPTYTEAIPTTIIESSACGVPAITSDVGGCPEIISDGYNGLLVPARDTAALAAAIRWMADHPAEREIMGMRGRVVAVEGFDHLKMAENLIRVHLGLL